MKAATALNSPRAKIATKGNLTRGSRLECLDYDCAKKYHRDREIRVTHTKSPPFGAKSFVTGCEPVANTPQHSTSKLSLALNVLQRFIFQSLLSKMKAATALNSPRAKIATKGNLTRGSRLECLDYDCAKKYHCDREFSEQFHINHRLSGRKIFAAGCEPVANTPQHSTSKLFLSLITLLPALAFAFYEPNSQSFKSGFEAGLTGAKLQGNMDGFKPTTIRLTKPYLLVFHINDTPLTDATFLQILGIKEGFETHLTKDFLSFGEYEREVDARAKAKEIEEKFKLNAAHIKILKDQTEILTYPYLWSEFHNDLLVSAKNAGVYVIETEKIVYRDRIVPVVKKISKPAPKISSFSFKLNKAMGYSTNNENKSANFMEIGLVANEKFELEKEVITKENERFVKVKGKNLYFLKADVEVFTQENN